jgi:hypothetical protein
MVHLASINQAIVGAYGSATAPHYGFLQKTYNQRPYQPLVEELAGRFALTESTDLNYDVAFMYGLHRNEQHYLLLSLVGKFCLLFHSRVGIDSNNLVEQPVTEEAQIIDQAVRQHGFRSIDRATLAQTTCLADREGGKKTVWEALFERS